MYARISFFTFDNKISISNIMNIINKIIEFLKQYLIAIAIFLALSVLLKIAETFYFVKWGEIITFSAFFKSFLPLIIANCFYAVLLLPGYVLFNFLNKTLARIFISIIFSWLMLLEAGLTVYLFKTGALMGAELLIRPISEVIATIKTVISLWIPTAGLALAPTIFYVMLLLLNKKILNAKVLSIFSISILIIALFVPCLSGLYTGVKNPILRNYVQNKSFYCLRSVKAHFPERKYDDIFYDEAKIKEFIQENPARKIINEHYPLEREYEKNNVLAPYFKPDTKKPNIVIIVLESLGREWNYPNPNGVSFTQFLDSLANTGLYWKNCISTTRRSFGVVPALTGSLPFGVKGFQFGSMPEHHSLIKMLKNNQYKTNAFYAGAFYFDAINDYLLAQDIDYMSENFYIHYERNKTEQNGSPYWGYHDSILFAKILQDPNFLHNATPLFNLIVTTSAHQEAEKNNPYFKRAYRVANEIIAAAPKGKQEYYAKRIDRITTIVYQDLCLRDFFEHYKKRADFENTIFVFTGDHTSGVMPQNDLSAFHVPLVIWSPLLLSHKIFPALVSHNDLVPTIEALLREYYNLESSPYTHWLGNSLDTSSHFGSRLKTVMFDYSNGYKDMIYNNYYYNNHLFEIQDENLSLKEIQDDSLTEFMQNKLNLYRYIHKYAYIHNKLTNHPLFSEVKYKTIKNISINTFPVFFNSAPKRKNIILYPEIPVKGAWKKIKISVTADIMFSEIPENQDFYEFIIECKGKDMQNADYYHDYINKFIVTEEIEAEKWYPLRIEKQFLTEDASGIKIKMFFCMGRNRAKNNSTLENVKILIEGETPYNEN